MGEGGDVLTGPSCGECLENHAGNVFVSLRSVDLARAVGLLNAGGRPQRGEILTRLYTYATCYVRLNACVDRRVVPKFDPSNSTLFFLARPVR